MQCKKTDKCLFASGFAFYMMIYYCATNYAPFDVMNGNSWGTKLNEIHAFPTDGLMPGGAFLDNETGDMYLYAPVSDNNIDSW